VGVEGDALLTTVVGGGGRRDRRGTSRAGAEGRVDGGSEGLSRDTLTNDGNVRLGEGSLGVRLDGVKSDGLGSRSEERVAKATAEGSGVGGLDTGDSGVGSGGKSLTLNVGEDKLGELVGEELSRREDRSEEGEEVGPGRRSVNLKRESRCPQKHRHSSPVKLTRRRGGTRR